MLARQIQRYFSSKNDQAVRVRFAPSPTGSLHLGGLRTALFNYLFAKKNNGEFILRIEDTDQKRLVQGSVENIVKNLKYFQIQWDEGPGCQGKDNILNFTDQGSYGPYFQSQRLEIYNEYVKKLVDNGHAYYCFCCAERLEKLRVEQTARKEAPRYDGLCRNLTNEDIRAKILDKERYTIRLRVPEGETSFHDIIHGKVSINHAQVEDQILMKSDGFPTYHLANVIDDYTMKISHVIRGQEWITSTPKHIILYQALNLKPPKFAHIPLLLKKGGGKISKRDQNSSVDYLRESDYLPEAVNNFTALLGWCPKLLEQTSSSTQKMNIQEEVLEMSSLISLFTLERINGSDSQVDEKKLDYLNGQHMKRRYADHRSESTTKQEFLSKLTRSIQATDVEVQLANWSEEKKSILCDIALERIQLFKDAKDLSFFFAKPMFSTEKSARSLTKIVKDSEIARHTLEDLQSAFNQLQLTDKYTIEHINVKLNEYLSANSATLKSEDVYHLLRLVLSASHQGPSAAQIAYLLGVHETNRRISHFLDNVIPLSKACPQQH